MILEILENHYYQEIQNQPATFLAKPRMELNIPLRDVYFMLFKHEIYNNHIAGSPVTSFNESNNQHGERMRIVTLSGGVLVVINAGNGGYEINMKLEGEIRAAILNSRPARAENTSQITFTACKVKHKPIFIAISKRKNMKDDKVEMKTKKR